MAPESAPKPKRREERESTPAPEPPGTAVADFSNVVKPIGSRVLESLPTSGYEETSTFAMTQATGSCKDGNFSFRTKTYYSALATPRVVCPITAAPPPRESYPQRPENFVASGGCRPTFTAHKSGPVPPAQNLSLYSTIAMSASAGPAATPVPSGSPSSGFVFLTERGNVHTLTQANAGLFEIPSDFTRVP
jgi:hypothetical protein